MLPTPIDDGLSSIYTDLSYDQLNAILSTKSDDIKSVSSAWSNFAQKLSNLLTGGDPTAASLPKALALLNDWDGPAAKDFKKNLGKVVTLGGQLAAAAAAQACPQVLNLANAMPVSLDIGTVEQSVYDCSSTTGDIGDHIDAMNHDYKILQAARAEWSAGMYAAIIDVYNNVLTYPSLFNYFPNSSNYFDQYANRANYSPPTQNSDKSVDFSYQYAWPLVASVAFKVHMQPIWGGALNAFVQSADLAIREVPVTPNGTEMDSNVWGQQPQTLWISTNTATAAILAGKFDSTFHYHLAMLLTKHAPAVYHTPITQFPPQLSSPGITTGKPSNGSNNKKGGPGGGVGELGGVGLGGVPLHPLGSIGGGGSGMPPLSASSFPGGPALNGGLGSGGSVPGGGVGSSIPSAAGGPGTKLAGFNPSSPLTSGSGLMTPKALSGLGSGFGGGGLPGGGGPSMLSSGGGGLGGLGSGGLGPAGTASEMAAGSALAGRAGAEPPMMPPGMGQQPGGDNNRQRKSWLPEDENIWGADVDAVPPVISGG
ncbi:MAG: hypothetical protein ACRDNZ_04950 [Streptosporangiaceae bacterium]